MDAIFGYISAHPGVLIMLIVLLTILILHFIFKSLIKLAIVLFVVLSVAFGFYYFKDTGKIPGKMEKSIEMVKSGFNELADKSKSFFSDSKELYKKTKEVPGDLNKLLKNSDEKAGK